MGIKTLSKAIRRYAPAAVRPATLPDLSGTKAAIDTAVYMYVFRHRGDYTAASFRAQIERLRAHGIEPVYFFDGKHKPAKTAEVACRKARRAECAVRLQDLTTRVGDLRRTDIRTLDNPLEAIAVAERKLDACRRQVAARPTPAYVADVQDAMHELGVAMYASVGDGEQACAWAVRSGLCDVVVSEDFDCVPYAAPRFVTGLERGAGMTLYDTERLRREMGDWTPVQMVLYCLLLGSDLCASRVKGIGMVRGKGLVDRHATIASLCDALRRAGSEIDQFEHDALVAQSEFLSQGVKASLIRRGDPDSHSPR